MTDTTTAGAPGTLDQLGTLRALIANDSHAMTFQTFGQYRSALLNEIDLARRAPAPVCADSFAINFIEQRAAQYLQDHADTEPGTGALAFEFGEAGREYHSMLVELADDLRAALKEADSVCTIPPEGWACTRAAGHSGPCAAIPAAQQAAPAQPATDHATGAARAETNAGELPDWHDAMRAVEQMPGAGEATPLDIFIYNNEPAGDSDETHFRAQLQAVIDYVMADGAHATPSPSAPQVQEGAQVEQACIIIERVIEAADIWSEDRGGWSETVPQLKRALALLTKPVAGEAPAAASTPAQIGQANERERFEAAANDIRKAVEDLTGPNFLPRLAKLDIESIISRALVQPAAASTPSAPAGHKLVPIEPTQSMINAGAATFMGGGLPPAIYKNMLLAAPTTQPAASSGIGAVAPVGYVREDSKNGVWVELDESAVDMLPEGSPVYAAPVAADAPQQAASGIGAGEAAQAQPSGAADPLDPDGKFALGMLAELHRMGASPVGLALAAQLFGVGPCEKCGFRKLHCRCAAPTSDQQAGAVADPNALDTDRLDWLNQNFFSDEKDDWDKRLAPDSIKWKFFGPMSVQGDIRRVIDAAMSTAPVTDQAATQQGDA